MSRSDQSSAHAASVAETGVEGLDTLLCGGFPREEMNLLQGASGTGKTTLALQFLREGARVGEPVLFVTLSQSKDQLARIAASHGWSLEGISIHEFSPNTLSGRLANRQTVLPSSEVELLELFQELEGVIESLRPRRAVIDSLSIIELLTGMSRRYHRVVLMMRQLFIEQRCTLLAIADHTRARAPRSRLDVTLHCMSSCVIDLEQEPRRFGEVRRHLRVIKARGIAHQGGHHDLKIHTGHFEVFPRLQAYAQPESHAFAQRSSGIEDLDRLLGGGLNSGTSCLIVGPSGTGKSALASSFVAASARRGERAALYLFDARPETYLENAAQMGIDLRTHRASERVMMKQIDPGRIAPGEFGQNCRVEVERRGTKIIVIDSLIGYFAAMGAVDVLMTQLHELMTYLTRRDVLLILCAAQESFMSIGTQRAVDVSYLSDTIIALAFFTRDAALCRSIAVTKMCGGHLSTSHELTLADHHLRVHAEPLRQPRNVIV